MAELTDREKTIVHTIMLMFQPSLKQVPADMRGGILQALLQVRGVTTTIPELQDLTHAIENETQEIVKQGLGILAKHPDMLKAFKDFKF